MKYSCKAYSNEIGESFQYKKGKVYIAGHSNGQSQTVMINAMRSSVISTIFGLHREIPAAMNSLYDALRAKINDTNAVENTWRIDDNFQAEDCPFFEDERDYTELLEQIVNPAQTEIELVDLTTIADQCVHAEMPDNFDEIETDYQQDAQVYEVENDITDDNDSFYTARESEMENSDAEDTAETSNVSNTYAGKKRQSRD